MTIPEKKLKNGFAMPVYGIGTWQMGGRRERDPNNDDEGDIQGIRNALDAGVTHIDTAEIYAGGYSEVLVSKAIKGYDRSKLLIASKARDTSLTYDGILKAAEASLERVETDYFDLYMAHRWSEHAPVKDVMRALDRLVDEGLIKHIGVSNFNAAGLKSAMNVVNHPIVANQVHYNVRAREPESDGLLKFCQQNEVLLVAWRPLEKGDLAAGAVPELIQELAKKYNKTPAQIVLNWLMSQDHVVTLSKTHGLDHLNENLGSIGWSLDDADIERIRSEYPNQLQVSDTVPLAGD